MTGLLKRESRTVEPFDLFDRFDRMFDDWTRLLPLRRPALFRQGWVTDDAIAVDEFREDGAVVVRAELPGIDPEKDVEVTVADGMLHITAERHEEEKKEGKGYVRRELRYGSFSRSLMLPEGVGEGDVTATYKDGILEIRVPAPPAPEVKKVPVSTS